MKQPRILQERELALIEVYSQCQLAMTPGEFYRKWGVSYEQIGVICSRSDSTVRRWFKRGPYRRYPTPTDLRHLAVMDFLLEHFEEIPPEIWTILCPVSLE